MRTFVQLNLQPEVIAPAQGRRPEAGLLLRECKQLASELEIVASKETEPLFLHPSRKKLEAEVRRVTVSYNTAQGGFVYGIRDYAKDPDGGRELIAVAEATYFSWDIWEEFFPEKYLKELLFF